MCFSLYHSLSHDQRTTGATQQLHRSVHTCNRSFFRSLLFALIHPIAVPFSHSSPSLLADMADGFISILPVRNKSTKGRPFTKPLSAKQLQRRQEHKERLKRQEELATQKRLERKKKHAELQRHQQQIAIIDRARRQKLHAEQLERQNRNAAERREKIQQHHAALLARQQEISMLKKQRRERHSQKRVALEKQQQEQQELQKEKGQQA
ncbi:MAG: hypothetical protein J3R72DRAFT_458588 [Linnemannia gamsii]|nr:MAG: hypothetical protein J3R72DRAFT_458588 [Linnemannia gamsii]